MAEQAAFLTKTQRLERLLEISRMLTSTLELKPLLQSIVQVASQLTNSETASILLYNADVGQLRFEATPETQEDDLSQLSVPLDSSIAGWIFTNARPMVLQDAVSDPRVYRKVDQQINFQTRSILGVPLMAKQEPIGVLEAVNKLNNSHYTEDDLAVLETLAAQAAIAIENARLMERLQTANEDLRRLDRMKSDFIAIASHELRTPLGLILGHATFLKDLIPGDQQDQMEVIIRSAMRLKSIIEDMSTISHEEEGLSRIRRATFSMSDLIQDVVERYKDAADEKELHMSYDIPEDDPLEIEGDREKIEAALSNLIKNAIAFTDENGQVGIKAERSDGYVNVYVVDTGIGIPEEDIERVFDRFYQVESHLTRKHGGMGLGLSIAKAMVEMHNGQIWCESKVGTGSLFSFMLPIDSRQASAAAKVFKSS
jgi:signal transduction histidine kinase